MELTDRLKTYVKSGSNEPGDLLKIPGDNGGYWRIEKFLEFQHKVPAIDQIFIVEYVKRNPDMSNKDKILLFWILSAMYSEVGAVFVYEDIRDRIGWDNVTSKVMEDYWKENKQRLEFGSARRYAKNMNWFPTLISDFMELTDYDSYTWSKSLTKGNTPEEGYYNLYKAVTKIKFTGRFSIELFLMNFRYLYRENLLDVNIQENVEFDWKTYSNETSGLLNLLYQDKLADDFDKNKSLPTEYEKVLDREVVKLHNIILDRYGKKEAEYLTFMPRLCTFRNFCKGNRYVGFHHDRQLEFLIKYHNNYPDNPLWETIYDIRSSIYPHELLGELHDWNKIRPEKKKQFLLKGITGAEIVK